MDYFCTIQGHINEIPLKGYRVAGVIHYFKGCFLY